MSRKKKSRTHPTPSTAGDAPAGWGQNIAVMAVAGALIAGSFVPAMFIGRTHHALVEDLKIPIWQAIAIEIVGGAAIGAVAGVIYPMTRYGLAGRLAFGTLVGAMISVPLGFMLDALSLTTTAATAGLGLIATAGSAFQDWMKRPRA